MRSFATTLALLFLAVSAPAFGRTSVETEAAIAAATSTDSAPVDPSSLAVAQEILTIGFPPEKRSQMFASMIDALIAQSLKNGEIQQFSSDRDFQMLLDRSTRRMFDAMKTSIAGSIPDYFDAQARAYARQFSVDDLNAILAFVKTPAGQHFFAESTNMLKDPDVQAAGQRMTARLMAQFPEITRESMKDVEDYIAKKDKQEKAAHAAHTS